MAWSIFRNFLNSFRLIYFISRVFCFIPFSIIRDLNGNIVTSKIRVFDGVLFMAFITLHFVTSVYYYMIPVRQLLGISQVLKFHRILPISIHNNIVMILIMNMYNRQKIINIIKMFNIIDEEVTI